MDRKISTDVLVIGAGTAGIVAAIVAARHGKKVVLLEKNDYVGGEGLISSCFANFGGGTDYQKAAGIQDTPEKFFDDMRRWDPKADREVLRSFCETAVTTCHFLRDLGITWSLAPESSNADMGMDVTRMHVVEGLGPAFYAVTKRALEEAGGVTHLKTKATALIQGENGQVVGAWAKGRLGTFRVDARSTLISCGGFQGNAELMTRYVSPQANYAMFRGLRTNSGDGLLMGLQVGAATHALHRVHGYLHLPPNPTVYPLQPYSMMPADGSTYLPDIVQQFPFGVVVNGRGERFVDETIPRLGENIANALIHQEGSVGFAIVDSRIYRDHWDGVVAEYDAFWTRLGLGPVQVTCERDLDTLAARLGFDPEKFVRTIDDYNRAVDENRTHLLPVPKANRDPLGYYEKQGIDFLKKIDAQPYYAIPVIAGISHTNGGLAINRKCQVIDRDGAVIDGLYSGGDSSVLWHSNYGSAYARALITGYIAGSEMAGKSER